MTDQPNHPTQPTQPTQPVQPVQPWQPPGPFGSWPGAAAYPAALPFHGLPAPGPGPVGKVRGTGVCILLAIVTFGIYSLVWYYSTHEEMKRHTGRGLGGGVALLLAFFVGFVMPYITASEVGGLHAARGLQRPVSGFTGLWYFPGVFILVGPLIWFVKTNGALNAYWRSCGAR